MGKQAPISGAAVKASVGTIFSIPIAFTESTDAALKALKHRGFRAYGLAMKGARDVTKEPFDAPTDVVFDEYNVVQPDILVVCDPDKMRSANIQGAPDMIVEILSPSTTLTDRRDKLRLYERFEVREYLIVDPEQELVERYRMENQRYGSPDIFNCDEIFPSFSFPELELPLWEVFAKEKPA